MRLQTETDDVAAPEPGDGEDDAEKGQQHAEDEEGFAARDRRDQPVEVHPEKAGERGYGQEDQGHKRQAIDLLALFAGDLGGEVVDDVRHPLPPLEKLLLDVLHLVGVVVDLLGPADSRAVHRLDPGRRRANRTEIAIEARRCRLQRLETFRQRGGIGRASPPAESKPEAVKLHVVDLEGGAERSEQKLQQNAGRLVEIVLDASQALRELPADVVEGGRIATP